MFTEEPPSFIGKDSILYDICELDGKYLKFTVGEDVVDGERTTLVIGSDIDNGVQYVLGVYKTEEKEWEPAPDSQKSMWTSLELLHKTYEGESICDAARDLDEAFSEDFTGQLKMIPVDEYGFMKGNFTVKVVWEAEEEK